MVAYIVWPLCNVFLDLLIDFHSKLREIIIVTNSATISATYALSWCSGSLWTSPYGITMRIDSFSKLTRGMDIEVKGLRQSAIP